MKMVEQNISGVKLEQLRQNAVKKHKILPVSYTHLTLPTN